MAEVELGNCRQRERQLVAAHGDNLVHNFQRGDVDRRHDLVGLYLVGHETVEATYGTEVYAAIGCEQAGAGLILLAHQTVVAGESLDAIIGRVAEDALV